MAKQPLTYSNYGKIGHAKKTCHNKKKEETTILFIPTKVDEPIAKDITQPIKLARIPLRYPCIICSNFDCPKKTKVQLMFHYYYIYCYQQ
jgi:hypothetical protein